LVSSLGPDLLFSTSPLGSSIWRAPSSPKSFVPAQIMRFLARMLTVQRSLFWPQISFIPTLRGVNQQLRITYGPYAEDVLSSPHPFDVITGPISPLHSHVISWPLLETAGTAFTILVASRDQYSNLQDCEDGTTMSASCSGSSFSLFSSFPSSLLSLQPCPYVAARWYVHRYDFATFLEGQIASPPSCSNHFVNLTVVPTIAGQPYISIQYTPMGNDISGSPHQFIVYPGPIVSATSLVHLPAVGTAGKPSRVTVTARESVLEPLLIAQSHFAQRVQKYRRLPPVWQRAQQLHVDVCSSEMVR